jgi:hypothetical protein
MDGGPIDAKTRRHDLGTCATLNLENSLLPQFTERFVIRTTITGFACLLHEKRL